MSVRTVAAADTSFLLREQGQGSGVPVLLLHGVPETSSCWNALAARLADDRRVLAPDLPGLGGSSYGGPYDVPSLVAQLVALVEAEAGGRPVDVVGHDWGGSLALALAGARPDLVRRLVVANAPYRTVPARAVHIPLFALPAVPELLFRLGGRRAVRLMLGLGWRSDTPLDPETQAEYEVAYSQPDVVRAMLGYYRAAARPRLAAALRRETPAGTPRVRADKMLVLWGARDPVLPIATGESVVTDLGPECVMVTVPGAGHFVVEEAPQVVADVLADFLSEGVDGAAPPEGPAEHRVAETDPPSGGMTETATVGGVPVGATPKERGDDAPATARAGRAPAKRAAKAPAKKVPARKVPAEQVPAKQVPAEQVPAEQVPAKKGPAKKGPAKKGPVEKAPAKRVPATKVPATKVPATKVPATKVPATKVPAKKAPASAARKGPAGAQQPGSPAARRAPRRPGPEDPPFPGRD